MLPVAGGVARLAVNAEGEEPAYCEVELPPFWIGRCEVTWREYRRYMALDESYTQMKQLRTIRQIKSAESASKIGVTAVLESALEPRAAAEKGMLAVDAVTAPTPLYDESTTYESGEDPDLPAVTMTAFAARQYTKWLSALTGIDYRLPSEAEWEYAALAGDDGGDPISEEEIDQVAWHTDNSDWVAQSVGQKKPNAWGLHDTLGNVAELVLDAHDPDGRAELAGRNVGWSQAVSWPTKRSTRIAKGGWWDSEREEITVEGRMLTDEVEWKASDPNLPRSPWWYADYPTTGIGFRVLRPLRPIPDDLKRAIWDTIDEGVAADVDERLREGRGKTGPINSTLPEALRQLESPEIQKLLN